MFLVALGLIVPLPLLLYCFLFLLITCRGSQNECLFFPEEVRGRRTGGQTDRWTVIGLLPVGELKKHKEMFVRKDGILCLREVYSFLSLFSAL